MRASYDRLEGYQASLVKCGIPYDPNLVIDSEFTFDGGYTAARILLEDPNRMPSAIFAGNDEAAYGAIFASQEMGIPVPERLSVGGFDNLTMSKYIWPGLTTIHQPAEELVEIATRQLIQQLKNHSAMPTQILVPSRLIVRRSTGPNLS